MLEGQASGTLVIQDNVRYSLDVPMPRDGYGRQRHLLVQRSVGRDEDFHTPCQKHLRVCLKQLGIVPVNHGQEKIVVLSQIFFNPANDHGALRIANLLGDDANRVSSLQAQSARKEVWPIVQHLRCLDDAILGVFRDGTCRRGVVQSRGNRAGSKAEVVSDGFEGDSRFRTRGLLLPQRLGRLRGPPRMNRRNIQFHVAHTMA